MKLTQRQWQNIERMVLKDGLSMNAVAKKYGIHESVVRRRLKEQQAEQVHEAAHKLADAAVTLRKLPVEKRFAAKSLAEHLVEISHMSAEVAALGMANSMKLTRLKSAAIDRLTEQSYGGELDADALKQVYMLAETANKSGKLAVDLMGVGKTLVMDKEKPEDVMQLAPINIPALKS